MAYTEIRIAAGLKLLLLLAVATPLHTVTAQLTFNFYKTSCPNAEKIIFNSITASFKNDSGTAPGLLRLHFHDCFVRGCDGSVLPTSNATNTAERDAAPNKSLRGFEAVFAAKAAVEAQCPGIVSCADVLAYAARDSVRLSGGPSYSLKGGRRDAFGSLSTDVGSHLPAPSSSVATLLSSFNAVGLNLTDVVLLSGAHTIGQAHCAAFTSRIYPTLDTTLNATLAASLEATCPTSTTDATVLMDIVTGSKFDNAYYTNLLTANGLFNSDQNLFIDNSTTALVQSLAADSGLFARLFPAAMQKMGSINVLTGTDGRVKLDCSIA